MSTFFWFLSGWPTLCKTCCRLDEDTHLSCMVTLPRCILGVSLLGHLFVGSLNVEYIVKTTHETQTAMLLLVAGYARLYADDTFIGMVSLVFSVSSPR